jgi:hypothetical protein
LRYGGVVIGEIIAEIVGQFLSKGATVKLRNSMRDNAFERTVRHHGSRLAQVKWLDRQKE